jgi:hypothetical protein
MPGLLDKPESSLSQVGLGRISDPRGLKPVAS